MEAMKQSALAVERAGRINCGTVRPLAAADVPRVVRLRERVFRRSRWQSPGVRAQYFEHVFLRNPWRSGDVAPLVYEGRFGEIAGFVGVVPRPMIVEGRRVRAAVMTQFMVSPEYRGGTGRMLLEALFDGPQELTYCDVANTAARRTWESLGGSTAHLYNFFWTHPLRSASGVALRRGGDAVVRRFRSLAGPLRRQLIRGGGPRPAVHGSATGGIRTLELASMVASWPDLVPDHDLRPEYDEESLDWLLEALRRKWGADRVRIGVLDRAEAAGWFVYVLQRDRVAFVVQLAASPAHRRTLLEQVLLVARQDGAVALRGRLQPGFLPALTELDTRFDVGGPLLLVHSRHDAVLRRVLAGNAVLSGLDGEWWMDF
jgi:hypothetical protein